MDTPTDAPPPTDDVFDDEVEAIDLAIEADRSDRRWVSVLTDFLKSRVDSSGTYRPGTSLTTSDDIPVRVRYALNDVTVAACERLARILRSDLSPISDEGKP